MSDKKDMRIKIDNKARLAELEEKDYKQQFGVSKTTFDVMLEVLEKRNTEQRIEGGRKSILTILDRLVITLIVIDANSKEVIAIFQGKGSEHDFSIFKCSNMKLCEMLILLADSGFQRMSICIRLAGFQKRNARTIHYP